MFQIDPSQLEKFISPSLAAAAAICWVDPSKFPSVFFGICCLGFIMRDPLLEVMTRPISQHISESAAKTAEELFRDETRFDRILSAGAHGLQRTMGSDLENALLQTITGAIVKSTKDESLLQALTVVAKQSMLDTLRDDAFMRDSASLIVNSILSAVRDEELKTALLAVATEAVSAALQDEKFVAIFRRVMKDVLSDGDMYRASAAGLVGAFMPRSISNRKDEVSKSYGSSKQFDK
jgi:hypothetical protein